MVASLLEALIVTQPFVDGNRRTAWVAVRTFLILNGYTLTASPNEVVRLLGRLRSGEADQAEARDWIDARMKTAEEA